MSTTTEDLRGAMRARRVADLRYREMVIQAKADGWNNSQIARAMGVSEAAIRRYLERASARELERDLVTSGLAS